MWAPLSTLYASSPGADPSLERLLSPPLAVVRSIYPPRRGHGVEHTFKEHNKENKEPYGTLAGLGNAHQRYFGFCVLMNRLGFAIEDTLPFCLFWARPCRQATML